LLAMILESCIALKPSHDANINIRNSLHSRWDKLFFDQPINQCAADERMTFS
jgi:hypothetical protein